MLALEVIFFELYPSRNDFELADVCIAANDEHIFL